ncbi:hypothetical protein D9611_007825 [Ephemerocybe angulata]|uniref:Uncharacterized protein n=1 Tax=Ephemerocybe angulata TaxID=980116 RepID=A0A8H5CEH2_9AGAR|nr:hypothetical protein D9611_007825 [Tulosesus angulatus]
MSRTTGPLPATGSARAASSSPQVGILGRSSPASPSSRQKGDGFTTRGPVIEPDDDDEEQSFKEAPEKTPRDSITESDLESLTIPDDPELEATPRDAAQAHDDTSPTSTIHPGHSSGFSRPLASQIPFPQHLGSSTQDSTFPHPEWEEGNPGSISVPEPVPSHHYDRHAHPEGPRHPAFRLVGHSDFGEPERVPMPEATPAPSSHPQFLAPQVLSSSSSESSRRSQTTEQAEEEQERLWQESEELYRAIQGRLGFNDSPPAGDGDSSPSTSPTPVLPVPGAFPIPLRTGGHHNDNPSEGSGERPAFHLKPLPPFPQPSSSAGTGTTTALSPGMPRPPGGFARIPLEARPSTDTFYTVNSESQGQLYHTDEGQDPDDDDEQEDEEELTQKLPQRDAQQQGHPPPMPRVPPSGSLTGGLNVQEQLESPPPSFPAPTSGQSMPQPSATHRPPPSFPVPSAGNPPTPKPSAAQRPAPAMPKPQARPSMPIPSSIRTSGPAPQMPRPQSEPSPEEPSPSDFPVPPPAMPNPSKHSSHTPPNQPVPQVRPPQAEPERPQHSFSPTKPPSSVAFGQGPKPTGTSASTSHSQNQQKPPHFSQPSGSQSDQHAFKPPPSKPQATHVGGSAAEKPPAKPTATQAAPAKPASPSTLQTGNGVVGKQDDVKPSKPFASSNLNSNSNPSLHGKPSNVSTSHTPPAKPQSIISEVKPTKPSKPESSSHKQDSAAHAPPAAGGGSAPHHGTRYVNMLLALDDIPNYWNLLASFFTWILLAGFLLFPGTFSSWQEQQAQAVGASPAVTDELKGAVLKAVAHVPLFVIAFICSGIGAAGMVWLWWRWMANYIWLLNKVFVPGLLNALAGLLSTISNIYGAQEGQFSRTAKITLIVTATSSGILAGMVLFYQFWLLRRVQNEHWREVGKQKAGRHGEGVLKGLTQSTTKIKQGA